MKRHLVTLLALTLLAAATGMAQPGPRAPRQRAPALEPRAPGLDAEGLLRMRERLALSEEQVTRLRALRDERLNEQRDRLGRMLALRSRFRSGDLTAEEFRQARDEAMQGVRERQQAAAEQLRGLLTEEQRNRLTEVRREFRRQALRRELARRELLRREFRRDRLREELRRERFRSEWRDDLRLRRARIRARLPERGFDH